MKVIKKAATFVLAAAMLLSAASCSSGQTWSVKTSEETLPIGVYIYNTYTAYQEAYSKADSDSTSSTAGTTADVLSKTVEGKAASEWIEARALEQCRMDLAVSKKFKEMNLSFTAEETKSVESQIDSGYNQSKSFLEGLGIAKSSYATAYAWQSAKTTKIFEAIYGRKGTNPVSDAEVEDYFVENYTHFGWFSKALTKTEDGSTVNMSDEEIEEVKKQFEAYAEEINNGEKKIDDISKAYTSSEGLEEDPYSDRIDVLENSTLSDDMKNTIKGVENGKAVAYKSGNYYYLIYKYDIKDSVSDLSEDNAHMNVVSEIKGEEFTQAMKDEAAALTIETNDSALKAYGPSRVENALNGK